MPDQPMEERIREALEKHAGYGYGFDKSAFRTTMTCSCGEWSEYLEPGKSTEAKFRAHTVAVLAGIVREAQAEAWADGHESGFWNGRWSTGDTSKLKAIGIEHAKANNPYRKDAQ